MGTILSVIMVLIPLIFKAWLALDTEFPFSSREFILPSDGEEQHIIFDFEVGDTSYSYWPELKYLGFAGEVMSTAAASIFILFSDDDKDAARDEEDVVLDSASSSGEFSIFTLSFLLLNAENQEARDIMLFV